ncbi:DUF6881 domain-containing protein [Burkholderia perseverans]|uniref:DUF6881 domain-containing protein n=1 Tax=Burkholderia perseverans TaxID=2615214 RepID=UPI001FEE7941|nr:hypothetical protein [Burkholderia perseverans]
MKYIKVKWLHSLDDEPVFMYSELDDARWEVRKVEVFADGRRGFASPLESVGGSGLSKEPLPLIEEIALDPQFEPVEIAEAEFEKIWLDAHNGTA